jgi:hypothetical protein
MTAALNLRKFEQVLLISTFFLGRGLFTDTPVHRHPVHRQPVHRQDSSPTNEILKNDLNLT